MYEVSNVDYHRCNSCALPPLLFIGKQILERHYGELKEAIASGMVDDSKAVGLLDQWIIEGKYSEEEALVLSCDMLAAGMDTVRERIHVEERGCTYLAYVGV